MLMKTCRKVCFYTSQLFKGGSNVDVFIVELSILITIALNLMVKKPINTKFLFKINVMISNWI